MRTHQITAGGETSVEIGPCSSSAFDVDIAHTLGDALPFFVIPILGTVISGRLGVITFCTEYTTMRTISVLIIIRYTDGYMHTHTHNMHTSGEGLFREHYYEGA